MSQNSRLNGLSSLPATGVPLGGNIRKPVLARETRREALGERSLETVHAQRGRAGVSGDELTSDATIRALTSVPSSPLGPLGLVGLGEYKTYVDGHNQLTGGIDVLHHIGRVYFDHGFDLALTGYDTGAPATTSFIYNAALSAFFDPMWVHGGARINLLSHEPIEDLSAALTTRLANDATAGIAVD
jgi:hypothetical protein